MTVYHVYQAKRHLLDCLDDNCSLSCYQTSRSYVRTYVYVYVYVYGCLRLRGCKKNTVWVVAFCQSLASSSSFDTLKIAARPQTTMVPTVHKWTFNQRDMGTETMWTWEKEEGVCKQKKGIHKHNCMLDVIECRISWLKRT